MKIERAKPKQAEEISKLILTTIKKFNEKDNTPEENKYLTSKYTPEKVIKKIKDTQFFCIIDKGKIVGTAYLEDNEIKGIYVASDKTREGIGTNLLEFIENIAKKNRIKVLNIISSKFALEFYKNKGYKLAKTERIEHKGIIMTRNLMQKELK